MRKSARSCILGICQKMRNNHYSGGPKWGIIFIRGAHRFRNYSKKYQFFWLLPLVMAFDYFTPSNNSQKVVKLYQSWRNFTIALLQIILAKSTSESGLKRDKTKVIPLDRASMPHIDIIHEGVLHLIFTKAKSRAENSSYDSFPNNLFVLRNSINWQFLGANFLQHLLTFPQWRNNIICA